MSEVIELRRRRPCRSDGKTPAVEVATSARSSRAATRRRAASPQEAGCAAGRHVHDGARRVRRDPGPERLGQVDAGPAALDAAPPRRRQRARLRPRRLHRAAPGAQARQPRLGRGELLQEDVGRREPALRRALLRHGAARDAREDPGDPDEVGFPVDRRTRADGEPLARDAAEGRARAGAAHLAGAAPARRADDGPRPALEARGAGVHPRDARRRTTRRSCSARTTSPRRRRSPTASASSTAASCSSSRPCRRSSGASASTRSSRRSSPPPAASSRTRRTRTTRTGRCSPDARQLPQP